jgi:hypothetical protein
MIIIRGIQWWKRTGDLISKKERNWEGKELRDRKIVGEVTDLLC